MVLVSACDSWGSWELVGGDVVVVCLRVRGERLGGQVTLPLHMTTRDLVWTCLSEVPEFAQPSYHNLQEGQRVQIPTTDCRLNNSAQTQPEYEQFITDLPEMLSVVLIN